MKKKRTGIIRLLSLLLALVLLNVPVAAIAQEPGQTATDAEQVILLEDGNKIVITTETAAAARSTNVVKYSRARYLNSKDEELCGFALEGVFNSSTKRCVSASYIISYGTGGSWRVEEPKAWRDEYKAYGSAKFVKRLLGIKVNSESISLTLSY